MEASIEARIFFSFESFWHLVIDGLFEIPLSCNQLDEQMIPKIL